MNYAESLANELADALDRSPQAAKEWIASFLAKADFPTDRGEIESKARILVGEGKLSDMERILEAVKQFNVNGARRAELTERLAEVYRQIDETKAEIERMEQEEE